MGFFDVLNDLARGLNDMMASESVQKVMNNKLEEAARRAEKAERDYDAGRISFAQYSAIINSVSNTLEGNLQYQKFLDNYEKRRNG